MPWALWLKQKITVYHKNIAKYIILLSCKVHHCQYIPYIRWEGGGPERKRASSLITQTRFRPGTFKVTAFLCSPKQSYVNLSLLSSVDFEGYNSVKEPTVCFSLSFSSSLGLMGPIPWQIKPMVNCLRFCETDTCLTHLSITKWSKHYLNIQYWLDNVLKGKKKSCIFQWIASEFLIHCHIYCL